MKSKKFNLTLSWILCRNPNADMDMKESNGQTKEERRNFEAKVGACTVDNFCEVILSSKENWNSMTSYTEALLKYKKFD